MSRARRHDRPAAFLDRDGVINVDVGYPHRPDQLAFTQTAVAAIRRLNKKGYLVIVVTNQSGVARGLFGMDDVAGFHNEMQRRLALESAWIDAFYIAPYHPAGTIKPFAIHHPDRKPGAGMLLRAMGDWSIDAAASFMIGDKDSDVEAARQAGVHAVLVPSDIVDLDQTIMDLIARDR